jgi:hypothetical protein
MHATNHVIIVEGALYEPVYIGSKKDLISLDILSGI